MGLKKEVKQKSVQIVRKPSLAEALEKLEKALEEPQEKVEKVLEKLEDPLMAKIQEKSAKAEQKPEVPKKPDQTKIKQVLEKEQKPENLVKVDVGASNKLAAEIRRQQATTGGKSKKQINS